MNIIRGGRTREGVFAAPSIGLAGRFEVELVHARTGLVKRKLSFQNLITDAGLNVIGSSGNPLWSNTSWMQVGTGSAEPAVDQTSLQNPIGTRSNSTGGFGAVDTIGPGFTYIQLRRTVVFLEDNANGNLTELGIFTASSGGTMMVRQLLRDDLGVPTTIVKTDQDQLRVHWYLRLYPPLDPVEQEVTITGSGTHDFIVQPVNVNQLSAWGGRQNSSDHGLLTQLGRGPVWSRSWNASEDTELPGVAESLPSSGWLGGNGVDPESYTDGTFYRVINMEWLAGQANFATGIGRIVGPAGAVTTAGMNRSTFIAVISPKIEKTDTQRLRLQAQFSFGRYTP